jgi:F-type H+-transporting ATPase subunit epsilon
MAKSFKVVIVTPDKTAYEGESISTTVPGQAGYIGIWADHAPLVAAVAPGVVELRTDEAGSAVFFSVGTGFVEISDNVVNLMVDTCEKSGEIDVERAEHALERAR